MKEANSPTTTNWRSDLEYTFGKPAVRCGIWIISLTPLVAIVLAALWFA